jgi:hypothetical protein
MRSKELRLRGKKAFIALLITLVATTSAWATHEKILHDFVDLPQGAYPQANLTADAAGNLYGTTSEGGKFGYGAIFELAHGRNGTWSQSVLYSFTGGADGSFPVAGLVFDNAGDLYGTTAYGGTSGQQCNEPVYAGCGVVFELSPGTGGKWTENVLHRFAGYPNDGQSPFASLIFDDAGNLYGTTEGGGVYNRYDGGGTVFELTPRSDGTWTEKTLYSFTGGADGATPKANLIFDSGAISTALLRTEATSIAPSTIPTAAAQFSSWRQMAVEPGRRPFCIPSATPTVPTRWAIWYSTNRGICMETRPRAPVLPAKETVAVSFSV